MGKDVRAGIGQDAQRTSLRLEIRDKRLNRNLSAQFITQTQDDLGKCRRSPLRQIITGNTGNYHMP
jgi:hypothetical protein